MEIVLSLTVSNILSKYFFSYCLFLGVEAGCMLRLISIISVIFLGLIFGTHPDLMPY